MRTEGRKKNALRSPCFPKKMWKQDYFLFRVREDSPVAAAGFPTVLLAVMDALYGAAQGGITCKVERSDDGANHFALLEK